MNIENIYEKHLSSVKTIKYNLVENKYDDKKVFGVQVITQNDSYYAENTVKSVSSNKEFVENIINILYENSIDTVHCKDIIEDYLLSCEDV